MNTEENNEQEINDPQQADELEETNSSAEQEVDKTSQLEAQILELENHITELNDKYLRLYSEYENFRKRSSKERLDLINNAGEDVIKSMLPVIDDFERAIAVNKDSKDADAINEGVKLIYQKLKHLLTQKGLKEMDSKEKDFDVELHEAITKIPAPSKKLKGKVVDEVEKGYYLNEKVIRYAKVVIGE